MTSLTMLTMLPMTMSIDRLSIPSHRSDGCLCDDELMVNDQVGEEVWQLALMEKMDAEVECEVFLFWALHRSVIVLGMEFHLWLEADPVSLWQTLKVLQGVDSVPSEHHACA